MATRPSWKGVPEGGPKAGTHWYENVILSARKRSPNLINLYPLFPGVPDPPETTHNDQCRVCVVDVSDSEHSRVPVVPFTNSSALSSYLEEASKQAAGHRRIYILENLSLEYITVFGSHFLLDPSIFANHRRAVNWEPNRNEGNTPKLLSCMNPDRWFSLRYSEVLDFGDSISSVAKWMDTFAGRKIEFTKVNGKVNGIGIARRKASFWRRDTKDNGWDVLILVDPPVTHCQQKRVVKVFNPIPYQGGYVDFTPHSYSTKELLEAANYGPRRVSPFDDLIFYFTQQHDFENRPDLPALILKKMVASHYMVLIEYVKYIVSDTERVLRKRGEQLNKSDKSQVLQSAESSWNDTFIWSRRISEYCEHIEAAMDNLGIDPSNIDTGNVRRDWDNWADDYKCIYRRMRDLKMRITDLIFSVNGLIGIMETKFSQDQANRSLKETEVAKKLTILATLFVPLSFTAGLFSMNQDYGPGGSHFWIYVVVAIPLVLITFAGVFVMDMVRKLNSG